ncbi:MAG: ADP-glyceromanno-heptose 6-epimerase [Gammaproteobacteria bacterium]
MIVVTGGAGFIGSNLVHGLIRRGHEDIIVVDDLSQGGKFTNLVDARIRDYMDKEEFLHLLEKDDPVLRDIHTLFHQGACSVTTEWDGRYMMDNNYRYSKQLLEYCGRYDIRFIYASSAAVYGVQTVFEEEGGHELPINVYGYSKSLFDHYLRVRQAESPFRAAGLRYFNVYGPREGHKGSMASVMHHFNRQLLEEGRVNLFRGSGGYADGEQRRDFVHVDDVVEVNLWLMKEEQVTGIFNVGTGHSRSFNDVAAAAINWHGHGEIRYIEFPSHMEDVYQSFTEADITSLRKAGCRHEFRGLEEGVRQYLDWLNA